MEFENYWSKSEISHFTNSNRDVNASRFFFFFVRIPEYRIKKPACDGFGFSGNMTIIDINGLDSRYERLKNVSELLQKIL